MLKCVGVRRTQGASDTMTWDSIYFSLMNDHAPDTEGIHCEAIKISKEDYPKVVGRPYENYREFLDKNVSVQYFNAGNRLKLAEFSILPDQPANNVNNVKK